MLDSTDGGGLLHQPVLVKEVSELLDCRAGMTVLDATIGYGGHAQVLMEQIGPQGVYIGLDQDITAIEYCRQKFKDRPNLKLAHANFSQAAKVLEGLGVKSVDRALADLGVSSLQIDRPDRGFSFAKDGPLDMRMDASSGELTAREIVNYYDEKKLADLIYEYGEERLSRRIARMIVQRRERGLIESTAALAQIVWESVPRAYRYGRIHPATRTFQAIRIAVNDEMNSLRVFLQDVLLYLGLQGRLAAISFHSLEDREIKTTYKKWQEQELAKVLTKKPVCATEEEITINPRSRSAKLRVTEIVSLRSPQR